jgi:hypothetical protein
MSEKEFSQVSQRKERKAEKENHLYTIKFLLINTIMM